MKDFAKRLERLIEHRRPLTHAELAEKIGVHKNSISAYVRGELVPSAEVALKLGNYFGCSLDWLLRGMTFEQFKYENFSSGGQTGDVSVSEELREILPDGEVIEERRSDYRETQIKKIIFLARQLSEDDRKKLIKVIQVMFEIGKS